MSKNRMLMVIADGIRAIDQVKWDQDNPKDSFLKISTGSISSFKIIAKKVVEIQFERVTLIFDITEPELGKIIWED